MAGARTSRSFNPLAISSSSAFSGSRTSTIKIAVAGMADERYGNGASMLSRFVWMQCAGDERRLLRRRNVALRRARRSADARRHVRRAHAGRLSRSAIASVQRRDGSRARRHLHGGVVPLSRRRRRTRRARASRSCSRERIATQPLRSAQRRQRVPQPAGRPRGAADRVCGLKGYAIGGARVSEKHANFIVNPQRPRAGGGHRGADRACARRSCERETGVALETEVRIVG